MYLFALGNISYFVYYIDCLQKVCRITSQYDVKLPLKSHLYVERVGADSLTSQMKMIFCMSLALSVPIFNTKIASDTSY